jgi:hypothetical protein
MMTSAFTLPLVGRVANKVSGVGVKDLRRYPHPDSLRGSTLPTRGRVNPGAL